ncbi:hypothetical protein [Stenomitos frigidus]|uniref:hypothetical protein n=1 Tax=Stenomitos frigidus TaxID=1886765 RepID=UPI001C62D6EC|nr:hypothetical protein [Stenomitos frigidus]
MPLYDSFSVLHYTSQPDYRTSTASFLHCQTIAAALEWNEALATSVQISGLTPQKPG